MKHLDRSTPHSMATGLGRFQRLQDLARRAGDRARTLMLVPAVALIAHPAFAELPKITAPTDGIGGVAADNNNWLAQMGAWFKLGMTILGLVLGSVGFIYVVSGALQKWKQYAAGRAEIGDLKEYFIMGAILTVFLVVMIGYAMQTLA